MKPPNSDDEVGGCISIDIGLDDRSIVCYILEPSDFVCEYVGGRDVDEREGLIVQDRGIGIDRPQIYDIATEEECSFEIAD